MQTTNQIVILYTKCHQECWSGNYASSKGLSLKDGVCQNHAWRAEMAIPPKEQYFVT